LTLAVTLGCSSRPEKRGTEQYADDKVLEARVKSALATEEGLDAKNVKVETYRGVAQLSGFVPDQGTVDRAVTAARRVSGVRDVRSSIQLRPNLPAK
jgi:osmotically-inducible protein OsmY